MRHTIPQEWIDEAHMTMFRPSDTHWRCSSTHEIVALAEIAALERDPGIELDKNGFRKDRMMLILSGLSNAEAIPPIELWPRRQPSELYDLADGFHRLYAAITFGYSHIPAVIRTWR